MMNTESQTVTAMGTVDLPWAKRLEMFSVEFEGGISLLRLRFREGKRFTIIELDHDTAAQLGATLTQWAENHPLPDEST